MLNKPQLLRRLLALCGLLLLCSSVALSQLFQLQLLNGEKYVRRSAEFLTTTSTVSAARGEILDRYGRPLVTNNTGFSLVLIYSSFWDGNDKRFDTLLDLTHRIQTAAVDATAKQNAAKTAAATDTSSDTSADATDSTDTSSDTPTDTAQAVSADTAAIPSINDRLPITQSAPFTYNSASLTELSGYMKDSAKSLGLDAVTAAVDAAKQASETDPKTDENGNTIDQAAQVDATKLVSPTEFINAMRAYMEKNLGMPTDLSLADARTMVGIYYSMRTVGFSNQATYTLAVDVLFDGETCHRIEIEQIDTTSTHGTGCTLSSAIASNLALGHSVPEAVKLSKEYVTDAIRHAPGLGHGCGPLNHFCRIFSEE